MPDLSDGPLITPEELREEIAFFTLDRLRVDWRSGPPYSVPPEVDTERTWRITFQREVIQHRVFSDEQLRSTNPSPRCLRTGKRFSTGYRHHPWRRGDPLDG